MLSQFVFVLKIKIKQAFTLFSLQKISVLLELALGHLRYLLTDVPPQPNSPPDNVPMSPPYKSTFLNSIFKNENKI